MKKFLTFALVLCVSFATVFGFAGCNANNGATEKPGVSDSQITNPNPSENPAQNEPADSEENPETPPLAEPSDGNGQDDDEPPAEPPTVDPEPTESEPLYDEQGNPNIIALAGAFKEYLNNESIKAFLSVDVSENGVACKTYCVVDGVSYIQKYKIYNKLVWESVKSSETKQELVATLKKIDEKRSIIADGFVEAEYTTRDYSQEQKAQFDAMTKSIFARLGLNPNNIMFAYKTKQRTNPTDPPPSYENYGYVNCWNHYYIYYNEETERLEEITFEIIASSDRNGGTIDNVINHPEYWDVNEEFLNRTPLQEGNEALYENASQ